MPTQSEKGQVRFTVPLGEVKCAASGDSEQKGFTVRGHAAVFNRLSHDMGGLRFKIAPGAFTKVLDGNPDVHLLIDHDTKYVLARTKNKTLELREDPMGLHMWANMLPTSYAKDLSLAMERGDVDQMSFACDIGEREWFEKDGELPVMQINTVEGLYDVTICAQGAFPQTDSQLVASGVDAGHLLASAIEAGLVSGRAVEGEGPGQEGVAQDTEAAGSPGGEPAGAATVAADGGLDALKADAEARYALIRADLPS